MSHTTDFIHDAIQILTQLDVQTIDRMVSMLVKLRERAGRLFILGVGGSAANASHMVNDFRKIAQIETYAPTDNVAELTARTNDEGWDTVFVQWLATSRLTDRDMVFILSVGGGDLERNISPNLVRALQYAQEIGADHLRHCRPQWRVHGARGRCLRDRAHRQLDDRDAARRGVSGGPLAPHWFRIRRCAVEMKWESPAAGRHDAEETS